MTCGAPFAPAVAGWPRRCASRKRRSSAVQPPIAPLVARDLGLRLRDDLAVSALVAWREVEHLQPAHSRGSRQRARLASGQVIALAGLIEIAVQERRLAEEDRKSTRLNSSH